MGWDVIGIGLSHDLPVDDLYAMGETIAQRMKTNVRLSYKDEYQYDATNNVVWGSRTYDIITLGEIIVNDAKDFVELFVYNYQAQQIVKQAGKDTLYKASFIDCTSDSFFSDIESPIEWYEIFGENDDIKIYKETIDINVDIAGRWHWWETYFHDVEKYREVLHQYRMQFYQKAKLFGCRAIIICSDQGPGQYIYEEMRQSAEKLKAYARSYAYLNGNSWLRHESVDEWKQKAKHLMFSSVFQQQPELSPDDFIEVVYDDFADL